jgi:hypothetical protein
MSKKKVQNKNDYFDLQSISDLIESKLDEKFDMLMDTLKNFSSKVEVEKVRCAVRTNHYELERLEQYTRRENLRIHGWKYNLDSDLSGQVVVLLNHILDLSRKQVEQGHEEGNMSHSQSGNLSGNDDGQQKFSMNDISVCHPLKPKGNGKQQVIVRFISRAKLIRVFKVKRFLKLSDTYRGVYITDDLKYFEIQDI